MATNTPSDAKQPTERAKKAPAKRAASRKAPAADPVRREVVSLGIDFEPIPVDMGDGRVWLFSPDPEPGDWSNLISSLQAFRALKGLEQAAAEGGDLPDIGALLTNLSKALEALITTPAQRKAWVARGYGLGPMTKLSERLIAEITGFSQP